MTNEDLTRVCKLYRDTLAKHYHTRKHFGSGVPTTDEAISHVLFVCDELPKMLASDKSAAMTEKCMRWLGFAQGSLFALGFYSIDEMRAHNNPACGAVAELVDPEKTIKMGPSEPVPEPVSQYERLKAQRRAHRLGT